MALEPTTQELPNGPVAAALIAGGIGSAVIGLMTVIAAASPAIRDSLAWSAPAGPITGKVLAGVIAFGGSWVLLHHALRDREVSFTQAAAVSLVLLSVGLLCTFPPFYVLFAPA